ncbi:MAG: hypothetical protein F6K35_49175 [Okeania sp. SIO2H7]|nr:hypothetical protein [Okeania sp. SIO2H7]
MESQLLDHYFDGLRARIREKHPQTDFTALESEWRGLYDVAWADFHRFLKGWSPDHWKINTYSERLTRRVLARLMP